MSQVRSLAVALLVTVALAGAANAAFYYDVWPAVADGSMNNYPTSTDAPDGEGYAIGSEGNFRFTKSYQHMTFLGFTGKSDGPDGIPEGRSKGGKNDKADGVLLADWMVGKKAFCNAVYVRNSNLNTCDPYAADGTYNNDPVTIVGFRVANDGIFVDRGTGPRGTKVDANGNPTPNGFTGCCAGYLSPLLEGGENAPPAWRMGKPYVTRNIAGTPTVGYAQIGDINEADPQHEYYKMSAVDSLYPEAEVKVGSAGFGTTGFGGYSTNSGLTGSGHFAFDYIVQKSDATMVNSLKMAESDCTGYAGEVEPRDFAGDGDYVEGWYSTLVDRPIILGMVTPDANTGIVETKGLVFHSVGTTFALNPSIYSRDQGGGQFGPYIVVWATLNGDVTNEGDVDVLDLLNLVEAFGSAKGDTNFNPEADFNCDSYIDVFDLLTLVENFGLTLNG